MSRYFDQTLKASFMELKPGTAAAVDLKQALDSAETAIRETTLPAETMPESILSRCAEVQLNHTHLAPAARIEDHATASITTAYRALRTRLLRVMSTGDLRSVVITSALEGEGKTLTALNLAISCAGLEGTRVLLVDADLRNRGLWKFQEYPSSTGLVDVLGRGASPESAILSTNLENLYLLPAGIPDGPPTELFAGTRWKEFVNWTKGIFRIVIVDSPPLAAVADSELIAAGCDGILMVVRALSTRRETLQKVVQHLDRRKLLGTVLNSARIEGGGSYHAQGPKAR